MAVVLKSKMAAKPNSIQTNILFSEIHSMTNMCIGTICLSLGDPQPENFKTAAILKSKMVAKPNLMRLLMESLVIQT